MLKSLLTISDKVRKCNGRRGLISFFCLIAFKNVGAGGCAVGPGYLHCLDVPLLLFKVILVFVWCRVFIDFMVWACAVRVKLVSFIWRLGRDKAIRGVLMVVLGHCLHVVPLIVLIVLAFL